MMREPYRLLDLFSGIGGFSLGLERSGGFKTVAFCEIEPFCRRVLAKHWPGIPCYDDVRTLTSDRLAADGITVDAICGGFPCQDISCAGSGAGIDGARSGLWREYSRLIGELRPKFVVVENVAVLISRGLDRVLGDLAEIGYDTEWHCIPASAVGAPHRRDRIWIVAYPQNRQQPQQPPSDYRREGKREAQKRSFISAGNRSNGGDITQRIADIQRTPAAMEKEMADANSQSPQRLAISWRQYDQWLVEPDVGRVAHGVPARVDRLRALGNAVVPQIPEMIGRAILAAEVA
jgi:DNA (cytosine-5)-methyltransferase 1